MASNCNMPRDVVYQLLLRLKVKPLLRFKSVCKSWFSLIESCSFITQHVKHHTDNLFVKMPIKELDDDDDDHDLNFSILSVDTFELSPSLDLPNWFKRSKEIRYASIISCNGIICLEHGDRSPDVTLWNPATKQFRVLPKSPLPYPPEDYLFVRIGFVYDVKTNDYKVLRFIPKSRNSEELKGRVELYYLSTDSWRTIDTNMPIPQIKSDPKTPYRDGIYCWLGRLVIDGDGSHRSLYSILSFDINKEEFGTMSLPEVYSCSADNLRMKLAILRENIACIQWVQQSSEAENWHFKIWVMNEYGVKESWTNPYTIRFGSNPGSWARPIGSWKNGIYLLRCDKKCSCSSRYCPCMTAGKNQKMCFFGIVTQELKNLHLRDVSDCVMYKESLVSIRSIKGATM